ncbi:MAG: hypothetical protein J6D36_01710 [Erysipelotrichaceae bacterium]|nr:hypothetical protein [Erysipelotrichaceae bacterium]
MTLSKETKKELENFLKIQFDSVYCDTCSGRDKESGDEDYYCDDCHRQAMNWSISDEAVQRIITTISKTLEEQEKKLVES